MDLSALPGLRPADAERLRRAGVTTVEALRGEDPAALAARAGMSEARARDAVQAAKDARPLGEVHGAGPATVDALAQAGVHDVRGLLAADAHELAERSGVPEARLRALQEAARDAPAGGRPFVAEAVPEMRVVLPEEGVTARVYDGAAWRDELPLVTVRLAEDEDALMTEQERDAVVLKEKMPTAFVRLDAAWHAGVPIFKAKRRADGTVEEVRMTVHEVRERRTPHA